MGTPTRRPAAFGIVQLEDRVVPAAYFVSPTGVDGASGGPTQPWKTLQYAATHVAAGDSVTVRAGDYAGFHITTDGTATSRITFTGEAGARVVSRNPVTADGINLEGASYVTVEGFTVVGVPRAGIRSVTNTGAVIRNNTADQNGVWGILTGFSENLTITGNVTSRSAQQHGIYVSNSADNPVIRGNVSWGNFQCGIHMNGDASLGGDGIISNALVEDNVLYGNGAGGGSSINGDGVQNSVFRNNLIYDARASGISLYRIDGGGGASNNQVVNNTILVAPTGRWAVNISDGSTGNVVRNNILYSAHSFRGAISVSADSLPGLVSDYNLTEDRYSTDGGGTALTLAQWRVATGQDAHSLTTADPSSLFVNAAGGDYHLKAGSAALDKGTTTGAPATDAEGTARPQGAGIDIGHDELPTSPPPPPPPPPPPSPPPPPPPPPAVGQPFAVGTPGGTVGKVTMYNPDRTVKFSVTPFGGYTGIVKVSVGDVTGDGVLDLVAATEGGGTTAARVAVINGASRAVTFPAFLTSGYYGQVSVSVGDVNKDGVADIALGTNEGGPHARVFRGGNLTKLADFRASTGSNFRGRTEVAVGDVTGDGYADLTVTARFGSATRVLGFSGSSLLPGQAPAAAFASFTLGGAFGTGVYISAGDLNGDGHADLAFGSYAGATPGVRVYSGKPLAVSNALSTLASFTPTGAVSGTGVRVAVRDVNGDGRADLLTSAGEQVSGYSGKTLSPGTPPALFTFDPAPDIQGGFTVG